MIRYENGSNIWSLISQLGATDRNLVIIEESEKMLEQTLRLREEVLVITEKIMRVFCLIHQVGFMEKGDKKRRACQNMYNKVAEQYDIARSLPWFK